MSAAFPPRSTSPVGWASARGSTRATRARVNAARARGRTGSRATCGWPPRDWAKRSHPWPCSTGGSRAGSAAEARSPRRLTNWRVWCTGCSSTARSTSSRAWKNTSARSNNKWNGRCTARRRPWATNWWRSPLPNRSRRRRSVAAAVRRQAPNCHNFMSHNAPTELVGVWGEFTKKPAFPRHKLRNGGLARQAVHGEFMGSSWGADADEPVDDAESIGRYPRTINDIDRRRARGKPTDFDSMDRHLAREPGTECFADCFLGSESARIILGVRRGFIRLFALAGREDPRGPIALWGS